MALEWLCEPRSTIRRNKESGKRVIPSQKQRFGLRIEKWNYAKNFGFLVFFQIAKFAQKFNKNWVYPTNDGRLLNPPHLLPLLSCENRHSKHNR